MNKKIKERLTIFLFILMIIVGLGIILYPIISNQVYQKYYQDVIGNYERTVTKQKNSQNEKLIEEAREYNHSLTSTNIVDAFQNPNRESSSEYMSILNVNDKGMMGYISIPKIDVRIPIYHGTSSNVLQKGVGHLEGSSFPVGGENTHAILSAHRGLPSSRLFTDLNQLKEGDIFYIYILDQVFAYQVDQILVTEPSETEALKIVDGKDYVTLVTCTPYAINTHRLLVRGERIDYNRDVEKQTQIDMSLSTADVILYVGLTIAVVLIIVAVIMLIRYKKKKGKNRQISSKEDEKKKSITPYDSFMEHKSMDEFHDPVEKENKIYDQEASLDHDDSITDYSNPYDSMDGAPLTKEDDTKDTMDEKKSDEEEEDIDNIDII
jgi:sortase A